MAKKVYTVSKKKTDKGIGEMIKLGLSLVCYAVVSCTVLAIVNNFTAPVIKENQIRKANIAMAAVFPSADNFTPIENFSPVTSTATMAVTDGYFAKKDGKIIGAVVQVEGPTYDKSKIIVGLDIGGSVTGVQILEISDSPGFGLKANDPSFFLKNGKTFTGQFEGKDASNGFKNGNNFDSISGATITSHGLGNMISEAASVLSLEIEKAVAK